MKYEPSYWPSPEELRKIGSMLGTAFVCLIFGSFAFAAVLVAFMVLGIPFMSSVFLTVLVTVIFLAAWDTPR